MMSPDRHALEAHAEILKQMTVSMHLTSGCCLSLHCICVHAAQQSNEQQKLMAVWVLQAKLDLDMKRTRSTRLRSSVGIRVSPPGCRAFMKHAIPTSLYAA